MLKFLKPGGSLFLTVPCGKPKILPGYKVFGVDELPEGDYFKKEGKIWNKTTKDDVANIDMYQEDGVLAIVCLEIKI